MNRHKKGQFVWPDRTHWSSIWLNGRLCLGVAANAAQVCVLFCAAQQTQLAPLICSCELALAERPRELLNAAVDRSSSASAPSFPRFYFPFLGDSVRQNKRKKSARRSEADKILTCKIILMEYKFQWLAWIIDALLHLHHVLHISSCVKNMIVRVCERPGIQEWNPRQMEKQFIINKTPRRHSWSHIYVCVRVCRLINQIKEGEKPK